MAVVNATFPTTRKSTKKPKASKKANHVVFNADDNRLATTKARAVVAMYYLMK